MELLVKAFLRTVFNWKRRDQVLVLDKNPKPQKARQNHRSWRHNLIRLKKPKVSPNAKLIFFFRDWIIGNFVICAKMKIFIFLSIAVLGITILPTEGRVRRQIWPAPGNPDFFWTGNDRDYFNNEDFWARPPSFDRPSRNQNRKTTTENMGPITSTPRTIHYAPQGCNCPMTQQFNPVCGTDGNTYRNRGLLNCYQRCGTNVLQKRLGTC